MPKDIHVVIQEDDLYARDFITMLLMRDWRTRVVAEISDEKELYAVLMSRKAVKIDLILIDTEVLYQPNWLKRAVKIVRAIIPDCLILCTGTEPHPVTLKQILALKCVGYIMKGEIRYGLAAAIEQAVKGKWVITPNVERVAIENNIALPDSKLVIQGHDGLESLTPREKEIAKLAIIFNLSQSDLHDELVIRKDTVGTNVFKAYQKIGLHEIINGAALPEDLAYSKLITTRFEEARQLGLARKKKHVPNMPTLAFHLLTLLERGVG